MKIKIALAVLLSSLLYGNSINKNYSAIDQVQYFQKENGTESVNFQYNKKQLLSNESFVRHTDLNMFEMVASTINLSDEDSFGFSNSRGIKEINLFKSVAPTVILIVTKDSLGSGAVINKTGEIITNAHVVGQSKEVLIAFKPPRGQSPHKDDFYVGDVTQIDEQSDLALVKLRYSPKKLRVIRFGKIDTIDIGEDVHAIGHPRGNLWTYTKGFISQIRDDYTWESEQKTKHSAQIVIQTQTPINPGNSGGPLLNDNGELIGINSFKRTGGEGLNYAVSVKDVNMFLARENNRYLKKKKTPEQILSKKWKVNVIKAEMIDFYNEGKKKDFMVAYDSTKNNKADTVAIDIDANNHFEIFIYDTNENGKPNIMTIDNTNNDKPNIYYKDTNEDGTYNVKGYDYDEDGKIDKFENI